MNAGTGVLVRYERWRPVVNWEGWHDVSDLGRVRLSQAGRMLNCDKFLVSLTDPAPAGSAPAADARIPWFPATLVRWDAAPPKAGGRLFVVLADNGGPVVTRLALAGGDPAAPGRYWRNVRASALTVVTAEEVIKPGVMR